MADEPNTDPAPEPAHTPEPPKPADPGKDWESEVTKWKGLSRQNEANYRDAQKQIESLTTERDTAKQDVLANELKYTQSLAVTQLHAALARAGVSEEDAQGLVDITDPSRLVADGKPSTEAITKTATVFARNHKTSAGPDPDQGNKDSGAPKRDMDSLIRAAVRGNQL